MKKQDIENKIPLTHRTGVKVTAFILTVLMLISAGLSILGIGLMVDAGVYTSTRDQAIKNGLYNIITEDVYQVLYNLESDLANSAQEYCTENSYIYSMKFTKQNIKKPEWEYTNKNVTGDVYTYNLSVDAHFNSSTPIVTDVEISVLKNPDENSPFGMMFKLIDIAYGTRYWIIIIGLASVISIILLIVFLLCSSGHRKDFEQVQKGWGTTLPLDLLTVFLISAYGILFAIMEEMVGVADLLYVIILSIAIVIGFALLLGWLMSFALRIKLGKWWENTIIFKGIILLWKFVKILYDALKKIGKYILDNISEVPLIWKTIVAFTIFSFANTLILFGNWGEYDNLVVYWIFSTIIIGAIVVCIAIMLKKLQQAGEALARGDLSYKVDTSRMIGDFKSHGEALNSIAKGMNLAVEQRMRSERMKTELITNVSHDIKTPLTSIINYTDLISKENCDNEKITEYSQVLLRQSERLKRLIEDLVEASKASTGNLEVNLTPCDLKIFLSQVAGEYEEKLCNNNLQLITDYCTNDIMIMADGRRLWRVFDNLMNNVCKYAQSNSRVYLSLENQGNKAVVTLKNMSASPLNISEDELMERFVRGDSSRNTEGNGLGLSIAKSLTQLQNGNLTLSIDGDLFKVIIEFHTI